MGCGFEKTTIHRKYMNLVVSVAGEVGGSEFSMARQREDTEHVATL
jgi:hypothetical protein